MTKDNDPPIPTSVDREPRKRGVGFPVVGLGASAGGFEAFQAFLRTVPNDTGMAFVLVQHLDPTHESMLAELLSHQTAMPVLQVGGDTLVAPNHVYLIPPNKTMIIEGGFLRLNAPVQARGQRSPIDAFLVSLARDQGDNAVSIILSGAGSDGTIGLRAVKEGGGLTMAQSDESAKYDSMPHSATATGLADYVLPVEKMPATLVDYFQKLGHVEERKSADGLRLDAADHLTKICAIIQTRTGHDFNRYKKNTLIRRIQRRMQVLQVTDVPEYIGLLRKDDHETRQLFRDLLINVTQFFRDTDAFEALARDVIPRIVDGRGLDTHIRVWVPGCSTGEEAYSLAILIAERFRESSGGARVQIFASDIDEEALDVARLGRYPEAIAKDVSAERLARFFSRSDDGGYVINKDIRDMCIFSVHSVIKDPPFSKLDLISCRNLLIYLGSDLQTKLIPIFHYALKPGAFLFLGTSENISQHGRLFAAMDNGNRIFTRRDAPSPHNLQFPLTTPALFQPEMRPLPRRVGENDKEVQDRLAERLMLDNYAPAFAVVTDTGDIIQVSNRTGKYLELPGGAPNLNIVDMARPGLRNDLRGGLRRAVRDRRRVVQANVEFDVNGGRQTIDLVIHPVSQSNHYMVVFQDIGALRAEAEGGDPRHEAPEGEDARLHDLESELHLTKERLRTTVEELETSNEELKFSNEEMMSMNEELQSTNEELESSKEELQSINEELETVNVELRHRLQDLSRANSDLQNLFDSTDIATVFLSNDLRIKSFTPATQKIFSLIESDKGRPLIDLAAKFPLDTLEHEAGVVIRTLVPVEREIGNGKGGLDLLMRIFPYRTVENAVEGVVLTFVDVSRLKQAERRLAGSEARYKAVMHGTHEAALVFQLDEGAGPGPLLETNEAGRLLLGYAEGEMAGLRPQDVFATGVDHAAWVQELLTTGKVVAERDYRAKDGTLIPVEECASLVGVGDQCLIVVQARDIRERRENDRRQDLLMRELQHRVKNTMATVSAIVSHTGQRATDFASFKAQLDGRLHALADAHGRLTQTNWGPVPLRDIAGDAMRAFVAERDRVTITGEDVSVSPKAALTLAMSLHELATNAVKYGALSAAGGQVHLDWRRLDGPERCLELQWRESGGPKVNATPGAGFGRFMLEKGVAHDLDGAVDLIFDPDGVQCRIRLPLDQVEHSSERTLA